MQLTDIELMDLGGASSAEDGEKNESGNEEEDEVVSDDRGDLVHKNLDSVGTHLFQRYNLSEEQEKCKECFEMKEYLLHGELPSNEKDAHRIVIESVIYI